MPDSLIRPYDVRRRFVWDNVEDAKDAPGMAGAFPEGEAEYLGQVALLERNGAVLTGFEHTVVATSYEHAIELLEANARARYQLVPAAVKYGTHFAMKAVLANPLRRLVTQISIHPWDKGEKPEAKPAS